MNGAILIAFARTFFKVDHLGLRPLPRRLRIFAGK
jgi:hypothetical protein